MYKYRIAAGPIGPEQLFARRRTCRTSAARVRDVRRGRHGVPPRPARRPRGVPSPRLAEGHRARDRRRSAGSRRTRPAVARREVRAGHRHRPGPVEMGAGDRGARRHRHRTGRSRLAAGRARGRLVRRPGVDEPAAVAGHVGDAANQDVAPPHRELAGRRVSDHRAERHVTGFPYGFDPQNCTPAELARNHVDRDTFSPTFAIGGQSSPSTTSS